jgi:solute:Na+ symporter, SSS family
LKLQAIDLVVIILYFAAMLALGFRFSRIHRNSDDYFLGKRDFPGWAVGLSFIGTMISSVTFIALPADSFKTAWVRFLPSIGFPLVVLISAYAFIPFFRRGTITSAYQYLSLRFGPLVSAYGATVFLTAQVLRSATIAYLMAVLMSVLIGFRLEWCILIAGGITAVYTIKGGYSAVIWTDVIQTTVMGIGALVIISIVIQSVPGGLSEILSKALAGGKLSFMDLNTETGRLEPIASGVSLREKTAVMLVLVGFTQYLAGKLNQESVQRWCSSRTAREARKSMLVLGLGSLPVWAAFMFMGTCLWVYYGHFPDALSTAVLSGAQKAEAILPHFIITVLPVGLSGIVIAAALAAAMSTLSSAINSVSMVMINDIYRPYIQRNRSESHYLHAGRTSSFITAILMVGGAYLFHLANAKTLMDLTIIVTALLGGGIAGVFLIGMLSRRGDSRAVLVGIAATMLFSGYALLMQFGALPRLFDPYYTSIIANVVMMTVIYSVSYLIPAKTRNLTDLTLWDQSNEPIQ